MTRSAPARAHDPVCLHTHVPLQLDRVTAYHHGSHMVVEVEVILPGDMTVTDSHDIALALQHKVGCHSLRKEVCGLWT